MSTDNALTTRPASAEPGRVIAARRSTAVAFVGTGAVFASWVSRIPQVRSALHLSAGDLGLVLLALALGSVLALPAAAAMVRRFGTRKVVSVMAVVTAAAVTLIGVGCHVGTGLVVLGLFLMGFSMSAWAVAVNVQGTQVERQAGRAIMSRFHAGFSVGTVGSALLGAGMIAAGVPITAHLTVVGVAVASTVVVAARSFLPDEDAATETARSAEGAPRQLDRRSLLIGIVALAFVLAEGAGNDWIAVALVDDHHTSVTLASLGYAAFLTAMTLGRWTGPALLDRYGRATTIRGLTVVAVTGLLLFSLSPWTGLAFAGILLWGLGACLGYPVALSAAGDDPRLAARRVSTVSGVGQLAFLGGPPLIGVLGSLVSVQHALLAVPVLITLAIPAIAALDRPESP